MASFLLETVIYIYICIIYAYIYYNIYNNIYNIYNINIYFIYNVYYFYYIYVFYIYIYIYHLTNHTGKFLTFDINNVVLYISVLIKIFEF